MKTRLVLSFESLDDAAARRLANSIESAARYYSNAVDVKIEKLQEIVDGAPSRRIKL